MRRLPQLPRGLAALVLTAAWLGAAAPAWAQEAPGSTVVYLVRHAEKAADEGDPELTAAGRARAEALARALGDARLLGVHSTDTRRTRETAAPVAARHGLAVESYDAGAPDALVRRLSGSPGAHLVVGHSNTVPDLVGLLGGDPGPPIADAEYDRLYVVVLTPRGARGATAGDARAPSGGFHATTVLLRYGAPSGS